MTANVGIMIGYKEPIKGSLQTVTDKFNTISGTLDKFGVTNRQIFAMAQGMAGDIDESKISALQTALQQDGFTVRRDNTFYTMKP